MSERGAGALTALYRLQELKSLHKVGACNKFLEMWISSNGALGVGGDLSTPLLRWQTLVEKLASHDYEDRIRRAILHRHNPERQVPQGEMEESDREQAAAGAEEDESVRRVADGADEVMDEEAAAAADEDAVVARMSVLSAQVADLSAAVSLLAAAVGGCGSGGGHGGGTGGEFAGVAQRALGRGLPGGSCARACVLARRMRGYEMRTCEHAHMQHACVHACINTRSHVLMHACVHTFRRGRGR